MVVPVRRSRRYYAQGENYGHQQVLRGAATKRGLDPAHTQRQMGNTSEPEIVWLRLNRQGGTHEMDR